ncbi:MAG: DNA double-strand break repair nuclease NurA [Pyrobaculum sp.]
MSRDFDADYWIEPELMVALRRDIERQVEKMAKLGEVVKEVASLRAKLEIRQIAKTRGFDVYAVDSSFAPPLELVGGLFTIITYGYVGVSNGVQDKFITGALYFNDNEDISRFSSLLEKRLATRLLDAKAGGQKQFDLLILDGEIAIHPLPYNLAAEGGKREAVNHVVDKMLKAAYISKATVVAITKRVRSRYLSVAAGRCLEINDKVATSYILRPGEYFSLGKLRELLPKWAKIHYLECGGVDREEVLRCYRDGAPPRDAKAERSCIRLKEFEENFSAILHSSRYPHLRHLGDMEVIYYMPHGHKTAVRIEVLDFGNYGIEDVVAYLASSTSPTTGYPQVLDAVDQYVRTSPELAEAILTAVVTRSPELALLMWPTNTQKRLVRY